MSVGPVDVVVVDFPSEGLRGEVATILADLVASDAVRIFDLAFVQRAGSGEVEILEFEELDDELRVTLAEVDGAADSMLSNEDLDGIADGLAPGHTAVVVAWENLWAARLRADVHAAGGDIVAHLRIPADVVEAAEADLAALESEGV
jgi:hypothetical protein